MSPIASCNFPFLLLLSIICQATSSGETSQQTSSSIHNPTEVMNALSAWWYRGTDFGSEATGNFLSAFGLGSLWRSKPPANTQLHGQTVIVTGGNKGIGRHVSTDVASRGGRVIIACRDVSAAEQTISDIKKQNPNASVTVYAVDMASLSSIEKFTHVILEKEKRIDVLVNNAGIMTDQKKSAPETGWELMTTVNYLGLVYLTMRLLPRMKESSPDPRVVSVSSMAHGIPNYINWKDVSWQKRTWDWFMAYGESKQAVVLFSRELAKRNPWLRAYAVDPGTSRTGLFDSLGSVTSFFVRNPLASLVFRSVTSSGESVVHAVIHPKDKYDPNNNFLYDGQVKVPSFAARDPEKQAQCWAETARILNLESIMN